jgi:flavin reductase (DIM6/NTAB) family NADH-FMN oxidoreductase RutF
MMARKDTARNVRLNHEFVVNLADENIAEQINNCAASFSYGVKELEQAGLTAAPSKVVKAPHIAEAPGSGECAE